MSEAVERVVFDCNIFAQSLISPGGPAGACVERVLEGKVRLFWSDYVLAEIRRIPEKDTPRKLGVTPEMCERLIARVRSGQLNAAFGIRFDNLEDKDGVKMNFADGTWILFRKSGTEPMIRIYCESPEAERVATILGRAVEELDNS